MTLISTQENEIKRIRKRRKREAIFMAILDFFSVVATLVCVYSDALSLFGMAMVLGGPMLGLGLTIGVIGISVIAGAFWARKKFKGYREDRQKELSLMGECFELENENAKLGITPHDLVKESEPMSFGQKAYRIISKAGNRLMSFATGGFSTMLGMAGVLFGALSIAFTPAMPAAILALFVGVAVFSVAFGIASVIAEFYLSRSQGDHIEELRERKEAYQHSGSQKIISNLTTENRLLREKLGLTGEPQQSDKLKTEADVAELLLPEKASIREIEQKEKKRDKSFCVESNTNIRFFNNKNNESGLEKSEIRHRIRSHSIQ